MDMFNAVVMDFGRGIAVEPLLQTELLAVEPLLQIEL